AGALSPALSVGDVAIANSVVQHDMDTSALGDPVGLISGPNIIHIPAEKSVANGLETVARQLSYNTLVGTIASGDQFLSDTGKKAFIHKTFDAIGVEMEGAAIGHVCYINKVPFGVLRVISDSANGDGAMEYSQFLPMAADRSIQVINQFIQQTEV
ncbi:MAG: 5'-methylthioadenosine/S-adenosylhomocysteine nucleosidase, partial [Clostridia bacterium]|nr:5'-methylthioadenosine/S-adenosylhomocysteine nucleosidase [Clostridia bacterium]